MASANSAIISAGGTTTTTTATLASEATASTTAAIITAGGATATNATLASDTSGSVTCDSVTTARPAEAYIMPGSYAVHCLYPQNARDVTRARAAEGKCRGQGQKVGREGGTAGNAPGRGR